MSKIARIISLCLFVVLLSSCSSAPVLLSFLPETDSNGFGGREFVIKGDWPRTWNPNYTHERLDDYDSGALSFKDDAIIAHNSKIMEEYDCKIVSELSSSWDWVSKQLGIDVIAGTVDYDLMDTNANLMVNNIKAGYVIPWEHTGIDISNNEKFGDLSYLEASAYNGLHYGIWSNLWQATQSYRGVLGINKTLLAKFSDISAYELYENGRWTFDEFKNILTLCLADEEIMPLTYYDSKMLAICSILSNGANIVGYNEASDKYYYGMNDQEAVTGLEYAQSLVDEGLALPDKDYGFYFDVSCVSPFYLTESWCLGGNVEDMDMICFPFGPDGEYGVDVSAYRSTNERYVYTPITAYPDEVGKFVDIWFEELSDYPKSAIVEEFKNNNFYNDESFDMWMHLSEVANYDYAFQLNEIYDLYLNNMTDAVVKGMSIQEFIDSNETRVTTVIDSELNN